MQKLRKDHVKQYLNLFVVLSNQFSGNMKYSLFCLFFVIAIALGQQACVSLDVGTYSCSIDHPGHGPHGATMVFTSGSLFSFDSLEDEEECTVAGAYVVALNSITLTSTSDIACIVDSELASNTVLFSDCDFNSGCNSFDCESVADNGTTTLSCELDDNTNSNNNSNSNNNTGSDSSSASTLFFGVLVFATILLC